MKKNYVFLAVFALFQTLLFGQEIYLYTGKNFTNFEYKSTSSSSNVNLHSDSGSYYAIGFRFPFKEENDRFYYEVELNLNQYNAVGDDSIRAYSWQTDYFGGKYNALYAVLKNEHIEISCNSGVGLSTILNSKQLINGLYCNLINNDVFSGVWVQPSLGVQVKYMFRTNIHFSLGYNFSKSFNFTNSTSDKLSFVNNQIQFGIHFISEH